MRIKEIITETVNPKIFNDITNSLPMFGTKPVQIGDFMFDVRTFSGGLGDPNAVGLQVRAYDPKRPKGQQTIGSADFILKKDKKGNSSTYYYIDTIVRVTGAQTGNSIDLPIRFLKYKSTP